MSVRRRRTRPRLHIHWAPLSLWRWHGDVRAAGVEQTAHPTRDRLESMLSSRSALIPLERWGGVGGGGVCVGG